MPANYDADDYWGQAVTLMTGYSMPSRKKLFEHLSSTEGIPLFRLDLQGMDMRAVQGDDYSALSGWGRSSGQDYDLAFYISNQGDGAHDDGQTAIRMVKARIVMIGVPTDSNGRGRLLDLGEISSGGPFRGSWSGTEWDSGPMAAYVSGAKVALDALLGGNYTTRGTSWSGVSVLDAEAVSLASFEDTSAAFDRAKQFLVDQAAVLKTWEDAFGSDQAAWQGQAAGIFHQLIHQLRQNYDNYVDQLGGATYTATHTGIGGYTPRSTYGEAVLKAQGDLESAATTLRDAWVSWASTGRHDPHRSVLEVLDELTAWILANNAQYVWRYTNSDGGDSYSTVAGYRQDHPVYGSLDKMENWKKVGEAAVQRWNHYVETTLITAASLALSNLNNNWITDAGDFEDLLETRNTNTLTESYTRNQLENENRNRENDNRRLNEALNNLGNLNDLGNNLGENLNKGLNEGLNNIGNGLGQNLNNLGQNLNNLGKGLGDGLGGIGKNLSSALNGGLGTGGLGLGGPGAGGLGTGGLGSALNGLGSLPNPGGGSTALNADGTVTTRYPDGSMGIFDPKTGNLTVTGKDGKKTTTHLEPGDQVTNADGSKTRLNPDGTLTTTFPDGTIRTVDPATGQVTTTGPDGKTTHQQLNRGGLGTHLPDIPRPQFDIDRELQQLNHLGDLGRPPSTSGGLPSGLTGGLGSGLGGSLNSGLPGTGSHTAGSGSTSYEDYDSTPYTGGPLRSGSEAESPLGTPTGQTGDQAGSPQGSPLNPLSASGLLGTETATESQAGAPMGPMGTPMGPMGGAPGGAGGQTGSGERVRNVLTEPAGATGNGRRRPGGRNTSGSATDEDTDTLAPRRTRTSTTGTAALPFAPVTTGPAGGRPATESREGGDRERASWLAEEEDEDVWGTDEGAAPTVIG
ncbi:AAWKG family protein [Streptomyces vinaceus]|uniref:AAWKG family protein n=1 Tax=Streptomyces vinaceus TaxID=1960 RepID=UPI0035DB84E3